VKTYRQLARSAAAGLAALFAVAASAAPRKGKEKYPYAWGVVSGNTGCVIFAEGRRKHTRFVGAVEVRWDGTLDVIEQHNCEMKRTQWKETRQDLDALQKLALKDKLKLIKIPAKHTQEQLEEARGMCGVPVAAPAPATRAESESWCRAALLPPPHGGRREGQTAEGSRRRVR
jgi:hypothetical protein